jgi:hypothetical protein
MVDVVRGLMRPVITLGLLILMAVIYFTVAQDMAGPDDVPVQITIIATVLYVGTTAVLWWFGTRNLSKK